MVTCWSQFLIDWFVDPLIGLWVDWKVNRVTIAHITSYVLRIVYMHKSVCIFRLKRLFCVLDDVNPAVEACNCGVQKFCGKWLCLYMGRRWWAAGPCWTPFPPPWSSPVPHPPTYTPWPPAAPWWPTRPPQTPSPLAGDSLRKKRTRCPTVCWVIRWVGRWNCLATGVELPYQNPVC